MNLNLVIFMQIKYEKYVKENTEKICKILKFL